MHPKYPHVFTPIRLGPACGIETARQVVKEICREGNEERSRICIACNWSTVAQEDGAQGCTINPAGDREHLWGVHSFAPATRSSKVVIVGGGPGGLEAARVSALKGHKVTLFEAPRATGWRARTLGSIAQSRVLSQRHHVMGTRTAETSGAGKRIAGWRCCSPSPCSKSPA